MGAAGRRGALQNQLAADLGVENRNFFYIVKVGGWGGVLGGGSSGSIPVASHACVVGEHRTQHTFHGEHCKHCAFHAHTCPRQHVPARPNRTRQHLATPTPTPPYRTRKQVLEQRGLVVKRPVVVKREAGANYFTQHVQTNILHLPRFAPTDLGRRAVMTVSSVVCWLVGCQLVVAQLRLPGQCNRRLSQSTWPCKAVAACSLLTSTVRPSPQRTDPTLHPPANLAGRQGADAWRRL